MTPPTLYLDPVTCQWGEAPIPGAQTWQHRSMSWYLAWKRAQANRAAHRARVERERSQRPTSKMSALELLLVLVEHWERAREKTT